MSQTTEAPLPSEGLGWVAHPFRALWDLSWPMMISMMSLSLMTVVDTLFVGQLGVAELAGVGLGGIFTFTLLAFGIGLARGVKVLTSQACGAGNDGRAAPLRRAGLTWALLLGVLVALIAWTAPPFVRWLAGGGEAGSRAVEYMLVRSVGAPIALAVAVLRESLYGEGESQRPMRAAVVANLAHIPINALLIFGFQWGVRGAGASTVFAYAIEAFMLAAAPGARGALLGLPLKEDFLAIWRVGWALGLEFVLDVGAFSALGAIVARSGELQMAAQQIAVQLCHFGFLPVVAVAEASSVLSGNAVGANEDRWVPRVARLGTALATGYQLLILTLVWLGGAFLVRRFSDSREVADLAFHLLLAAQGTNVLLGAYAVGRAVLRGTGDVRVPALVGTGIAWAWTPPFAYLLGVHFGWGAIAVWLGLAIELVVGGSFFWGRLLLGGWHRHAAEARRSQLASEG